MLGVPGWEAGLGIYIFAYIGLYIVILATGEQGLVDCNLTLEF